MARALPSPVWIGSTKHQYGFRENRFIEFAIIELVDRITQAINNGNIQLVFSFNWNTSIIILYKAIFLTEAVNGNAEHVKSPLF